MVLKLWTMQWMMENIKASNLAELRGGGGGEGKGRGVLASMEISWLHPFPCPPFQGFWEPNETLYPQVSCFLLSIWLVYKDIYAEAFLGKYKCSEW